MTGEPPRKIAVWLTAEQWRAVETSLVAGETVILTRLPDVTRSAEIRTASEQARTVIRDRLAEAGALLPGRSPAHAPGEEATQ